MKQLKQWKGVPQPTQQRPPSGIWRHSLFSGAASPERKVHWGHREQPFALVVASVRVALANVPAGLQVGQGIDQLATERRLGR